MRETIAKAAAKIIENHGLAGLRVRDLAVDSGCAVGSIYNHFGDLDGVKTAVNVDTLELLEKELSQRLAATPLRTVAERLVALADGYLSFAIDRTRLWKALFEHRLPDGQDVPEPLQEQQNRLFALIESTLVEQINDPCDRSCAARALFAAVHGNISLALDSKLGRFDVEATRKQVGFVVQCVARGLPDGQAI